MDKCGRIVKGIAYTFVSVIMLVFVTLNFICFFNNVKGNPYWINDFFSTEFLISYQGGFVRRGLLGEIIYHFYCFTGFDILYIIFTISLIAYLLVLIFFFRYFIKKKLNWWLILSPFLCGFIWNIVRKDYMSFCFIILELYILKDGIRNLKQCWGVS